MSYRLTKIYTRKGDTGYTSLGDKRLPKDDLLVEAVGTLDELNSYLGWVLASPIQSADIIACLTRIQNELFDLGGELHIPEHIVITPEKVTYLETTLDTWNATLPPLKEFVLPGGNTSSATCHIARTICRRAERCLVKLHRQVALANPEMLRYLNRLSDLLFVCARLLSREDHTEEKMWEHKR
jgi:cob(I)alamin adenosyltransferase